MPWGRIDDRLAMSVKIRGLADPGATGDRALAQRCEALGLWTQILSWVSGERSDGFVTEDIVRLFGRREALDRLLRAAFGRAPLLHRREDAEGCECFDGRQWAPGWDYVIHDYLDRNPSRTENDVHRAKSRELKDSALKTRVARRDSDLCRYCARPCKPSDRRSDDGRTFDHVDPLVADGEANLVTACRGCNRRKGRRTPEAAGMVLLPIGATTTDVPTTDVATTDVPTTQISVTSAPAQVLAVEEHRSPGRVTTRIDPSTTSTGEASGVVSESSAQVSDIREHRLSGSGSAPDSSPDLNPDLNPTQVRRRSRSRSDPPPDLGPPTSEGVSPEQDQVSDLSQITGPTQIQGSPGTGRGGPGTGLDAGRPARVGPPPARGPARALNPYARPGPRSPDHHAGVPPADVGGGS